MIALERPSAAPAPSGAEALEPADLPAIALPSGAFTLVGRTLLVMAGAYLARALTEVGLVPLAAGVALGLAYAVAWQALAAREAAVRVASASFHSMASGLIAFPLIWETAASFATGAGRELRGPRRLLRARHGRGLAPSARGRGGGGDAPRAFLTGIALVVSTRDVRCLPSWPCSRWPRGSNASRIASAGWRCGGPRRRWWTSSPCCS